MGSDGDSTEFVSKEGQGFQTLESNHGWKMVVNSKKARRQRDTGVKSAGSGARNAGNNAGIFQALENEAGHKKALREALLQSHQQDLAAHSARKSHSDDSEDDSDGAEVKGLAVNTDLEKKPKVKKPKKPKVTVTEGASSIDAADLAAFLAQISDLFVASPSVQLIRFADYFERAFSLVTPTQFGWNKILKESSLAKAVEVPLCYIHESIVKVASDWLATMPLGALGDFLIWGLTDVLSDMLPAKGSKSTATVQHKTKVGVLVVLALTLRKRSDALLHMAAALTTKPQFQGQEKLTFLAWAYGQAALGDLVAGMQLWVQNLLPLACGKASTPASRDVALQFAESIIFSNTKKSKSILQNGASRKGDRLVPPAALDALMHATFPPSKTRTKATERFAGIYLSVKELALFGPRRSKATRAVAQQLLPLCLESASEDFDAAALGSEACSTFIWCLSENPDCFKQWEKLYLEKLRGSIKVMSFMCKEWSTVADSLAPLDDLRSTINIIRDKNHASLKNVDSDPKLQLMLFTADRHAKVLKRKSVHIGSCFKSMATFIAGVGIVYGFYWLNFDLPAVM